MYTYTIEKEKGLLGFETIPLQRMSDLTRELQTLEQKADQSIFSIVVNPPINNVTSLMATVATTSKGWFRKKKVKTVYGIDLIVETVEGNQTYYMGSFDTFKEFHRIFFDFFENQTLPDYTKENWTNETKSMLN